ncbi:MAG: prepilin-type N-terminal cleavage/methylation domain-containing protein [Desulfobulbaceae bacterium]|nr:prepilin-type N-terminal cleavage/methylation domain-containing protein [Desulfobulbaceae bacterium]
MKSSAQAGFTLIEIIVTLTLGAILGAMLIPFLTTALTKSGMPAAHLKETLALQTTMENITADYRNRFLGGTLPLVDLQTAIGAEGTDQANDYGSYHVMENRFVDFNSEEEVADTVGTLPQNTLKLTIRDPLGMTFTSLFCKEL